MKTPYLCAVMFAAISIYSTCFAICSPLVLNDDSIKRTATMSTFEKQLLSFDQNRDGEIQRTELPEKNREQFDAWDADQNGLLDKREQKVLIYFKNNGELPDYEIRRRQIEADDKELILVDGYFRSAEPDLTVDEFVGRALTFDRNNDGMLDKNEIQEMAVAFVQLDRINKAQALRNERRARSSNGSNSRVQRTYNKPYISNLHSQVQLPATRVTRRRGPVLSGST